MIGKLIAQTIKRRHVRIITAPPPDAGLAAAQRAEAYRLAADIRAQGHAVDVAHTSTCAAHGGQEPPVPQRPDPVKYWS